VRHWQLLAAGALTFLTVLLAVAGVLGWRYAHREADLVGMPLPARLQRLERSDYGQAMLRITLQAGRRGESPA